MGARYVRHVPCNTSLTPASGAKQSNQVSYESNHHFICRVRPHGASSNHAGGYARFAFESYGSGFSGRDQHDKPGRSGFGRGSLRKSAKQEIEDHLRQKGNELSLYCCSGLGRPTSDIRKTK